MKRFLILLLLLPFAACNKRTSSEQVYTLYRNSATDEYMRIHVATFDAKEGINYNQINCQDAAKLRISQPMVKTKFWCEKGYYKE